MSFDKIFLNCARISWIISVVIICSALALSYFEIRFPITIHLTDNYSIGTSMLAEDIITHLKIGSVGIYICITIHICIEGTNPYGIEIYVYIV